MAAVPSIEQDVFVGQDFYVPAFRVRIRGRDLLQAEYDVLNVTYTDSEADMDSFDLTVNNWDPDGKGPGKGWFRYSDTDVFDPWQDIELSMGYYRNGNDELQSMLVGEIVHLRPELSGGRTRDVERALREPAAAVPICAAHEGLLPKARHLGCTRPCTEHRQGHPAKDSQPRTADGS